MTSDERGHGNIHWNRTEGVLRLHASRRTNRS
jgi:hypothetical protein